MEEIKTDVTVHSVEADQEKERTSIGLMEMKSLKNSKYDKLKDKWPNSYVLKHKSGKIAELHAVSSIHACKLIGWRPRHVKIISENKIKKDDQNG